MVMEGLSHSGHQGVKRHRAVYRGCYRLRASRTGDNSHVSSPRSLPWSSPYLGVRGPRGRRGSPLYGELQRPSYCSSGHTARKKIRTGPSDPRR
ncbi:hypothetical protein GDO78_019493 [Eleutherodactylus coqui]|uniref:Uncharacterized protein n=1 Tax=Eleutherodactylus coqui TaxID=57060 RepID=A0A8J6JYZ3_ELECQ|nr:hypothetical protein GDO78_019493 [Eleutherodactylus coqui]